jgi:hypothetical protein
VATATAAEASAGWKRRGLVALETAAAVSAAGFVTAAGSWLLVGNFDAKQWWLVPLVVGPVLVAAAWSADRMGRHIGYATGGIALVVCVIGAGYGWSTRPSDPPLFAALRARETSATATAEAMTSPDSHGSCTPAATVELGSLGDLGPWDTVCVSGSAAPEHRISLHRPAGSTEPGLSYSSWPDDPDSCIRRIVGNWWAVSRPTVGDESSICPRGFSFQGA